MEKQSTIVRISELSEEKKIIAENMITKHPLLKRPSEEFNEWGLRFPIDYLNEIGPLPICLPLEYMAEYVDIVTKTQTDKNDEKFLSDIDYPDEDNYDKVNATAVGNVAYIALTSKNEQAQKAALEWLEKFQEYYYISALARMNQGKGDNTVN